ncbi:MAG: hypothetical protein P4N59_10665 [Negativicutes bacterium]|nr:hypothetical protein [Negativicutes bacterium]
MQYGAAKCWHPCDGCRVAWAAIDIGDCTQECGSFLRLTEIERSEPMKAITKRIKRRGYEVTSFSPEHRETIRKHITVTVRGIFELSAWEKAKSFAASASQRVFILIGQLWRTVQSQTMKTKEGFTHGKG